MSTLPSSPLPSLSSQECMETLELQHEYIEQLECEREQLAQSQQAFTQKIAGLTLQLTILAKENGRLQQESSELNKKIVYLAEGNKYVEENEGLKKDLKRCLETIRLLNEDVKQVVDEQEKIQNLFKKNQEEKGKLQLKLEKIELEEGKIKIVNRLDRLAYFTTLMVALTTFALFGALSVAILSGGALFLCYQWSKKSFRKDLENNLRVYSKAHVNLSEKACLHHLYPSLKV